VIERERADGCARQAEHGQRHRVGTDDPAVFRQRQQTFGDGADAFWPSVQAQSHGRTVLRLEELVLDHAGRRADQAEGVRVVAAPVARDVEHAEQLARRVGNRRCGAGQEGIALQVVLGAMHDDSGAGGQRGADGIGAAPLLVPDRAGAQRNAGRLVGKPGVAQRVQQHALRVGQDDHAVAVTDLLAQKFHHRPCMRHQGVPVFQRACQLRARCMRCARRAAIGGEAELAAAPPAGLQAGVDQPTVQVARFEQLAAGFAQPRRVRACGQGACSHWLVSFGLVQALWNRVAVHLRQPCHGSSNAARGKQFNVIQTLHCPDSGQHCASLRDRHSVAARLDAFLAPDQVRSC
jgi:hypothetical protein